MYQGTADRAKLPHGYGAEKTSPGAPVSGPIRPGRDSAPEGRTSVPEGTEEVSAFFRKILFLQSSWDAGDDRGRDDLRAIRQ